MGCALLGWVLHSFMSVPQTLPPWYYEMCSTKSLCLGLFPHLCWEAVGSSLPFFLFLSPPSYAHTYAPASPSLQSWDWTSGTKLQQEPPHYSFRPQSPSVVVHSAYCYKMHCFPSLLKNLQWSSIEILQFLIHRSDALGLTALCRFIKSDLSSYCSSLTSRFLLPLPKYFLWCGTYCLFMQHRFL